MLFLTFLNAICEETYNTCFEIIGKKQISTAIKLLSDNLYEMIEQ